MEQGRANKSYSFILQSCTIKDYPVSLNYKGFIELNSNMLTIQNNLFNKALSIRTKKSYTLEVVFDIETERIKSEEGLVRSYFSMKDYKAITLYTTILEKVDDNISSYFYTIFAKSYLEVKNCIKAEKCKFFR